MRNLSATRFSLPLVLILCCQLLLPGIGFSRPPVSPKKTTTKPAGPPSPSKINRHQESPHTMAGLVDNVEVIEDDQGIPHIFAQKNVDAFFMEGFLHARDRFFQMDSRRRQLDGTLAEILGPGPNNSILQSDSTSRGSGLYLAAQASLNNYSSEVRTFLKAYADGVNSYLNSNPLPEEYQVLKITKARPWTELDSVYVGKGLAVSLSFDLIDIELTNMFKSYQAAGQKAGIDGTALYFQDAFRVAPFDPTFVIPDATGKPIGTKNITDAAQPLSPELLKETREWVNHLNRTLSPELLKVANNYYDKAKNSLLFRNATKPMEDRNGSNWLMLSGKVTDTGAPIILGDQHFDLENSPTWYQIQINVSGKGEIPLNVTGASVAGAPGIALGHNDHLAWQATITVFDLTDIFVDQIQLQLGPNPIAIIHNGKKETVMLRNETFKINQVMDGKADNLVDVPKGTVTDQFGMVPFRGNGPLLGIDFNTQTALTLQQPAFSATQEIEGFLDINRAKNLKEFKKGLQKFGAASVNMGVISDKGEIAYFTTGEVPLRKDLEAGKVVGAPPFFIRDGASGDNDWLPVGKKQFGQTSPNAILPFKEMPQIVNPANNFIVSANNDPIGSTATNSPLEFKRKKGGIYYVSSIYASGLRAGRLTAEIRKAIASGQKISIDQARRFQGSGKMRDAEILLPFIQQAFNNAKQAGAPAPLAALANDAGIVEAMGRFNSWDFESPTGLRNGYDAFVPFNQADPTQKQIDSSVATTIYSMWRSQMVRDVIDGSLAPLGITPVDGNFGQTAIGALGNLLDTFPTRKGVGVSGLNFFNAPEVVGQAPEVQRDFIILRSLRKALDGLASPDFINAYGMSTKQSDYRWGKIHRLFIPHLLGMQSPFSIPSLDGNFRSPFPNLFGIPRDGGYEVPNACSHPIRANNENSFIFKHSPTHRFGVVLKPGAIEASDALAGGQSGNRKSPFYDDQLNLWLVCDAKPLISDKSQLMNSGARMLLFQPAK